MQTIDMKIAPDAYNHRDIDMISDILCDIIAEKTGHLVESLSFSIDVSFTPAPDDGYRGAGVNITCPR